MTFNSYTNDRGQFACVVSTKWLARNLSVYNFHLIKLKQVKHLVFMSIFVGESKTEAAGKGWWPNCSCTGYANS